jgi:hypothetical protein
MSKHSDHREVFFCDCGHLPHMFVVDHFHWGENFESEMQVSVHLTRKPLRNRISVAWRYLLGHEPQSGAFDSIILDAGDVQRLRDSCDKFLQGKGGD